MRSQIKRLILIGMAFLIGCSTTGEKKLAQPLTNVRTVSISTNMKNSRSIGLSQDLNKITEVTLPRSGFQIVTSPNLENRIALQVCASNDQESAQDIKLGSSIDESNCFGVGTGMAMPRATPPNYEVPLIISNGSGHNYYVSERRIDETEKSTVNINSVITANGATMSETYLIVYIDKNKDRAISRDELWFAKITWN